MDEHIVTDMSASSLARAIAENFVVAYTVLAAAHGTVRERNGITAIVTHIPAAAFNGVFRTALPSDLAPDETESRIRETLEWLRAQGEPFTWYSTSTTEPADLPRLLEARSLRLIHSSPGMAVDISTLDEDVRAPVGLEIAPIRDARELPTWVRTSNAGFGIPDAYDAHVLDVFDGFDVAPAAASQLFLARFQGEPVGTAALVLGGGVAGLYSIATLTEHRRQGIGAQLTLAALREARQRGYRAGVLEASTMGRPVYERLGFREYVTHHAYEPEGQDN